MQGSVSATGVLILSTIFFGSYLNIANAYKGKQHTNMLITTKILVILNIKYFKVSFNFTFEEYRQFHLEMIERN